MKRLLFSVLFAACAAVGFSSCMNGDYDADPDTANTAPNPLANNNNGGSTDVGIAQKGQIRCVVNGTPVVINGAGYSDILGRNISGSRLDGSIEKAVSITLNPYNSVATYALGGATNTNAAGYTYTDFSSNPGGTHYGTVSDQASGEVIITSEENDVLVGTFHFEAYDDNNNQKVSVTNGTFNVAKR